MHRFSLVLFLIAATARAEPPPGPWRVEPGRSVVRAANGAVASSQPLAAQVGLRVLLDGGNAVDAAVAMAATLAVVEPGMSGLGGDAFALVYSARDGKARALNASGGAPAALPDALRQRGLARVPMLGPLSVTVPGALAGWVALLRAYGTRPLGALLQPAIEYAEQGFIVPERLAEDFRDFAASLRDDAGAQALLQPGGRPLRAGERLRQPQLAKTLRALAAAGEGAEALFYRGAVGGALTTALAARGGVMTAADLAGMRPAWTAPLVGRYRGVEVLQCPPNSQGQTALWALAALEGQDLRALAADPPAYYLALQQALRAAQTRRDAELGDPGRPGGDTTAIVVADRARNVVAYTGSLYWMFGSGVLASDTGVLLHNRAAAFHSAPGHRNALAPGRRPLHSNMPALVLRGGRPLLALAVVGGDMQAQAQVQVLSGIFDLGLGLQQALEAPRFLLTGGGVILDPRFSAAERAAIAGRGVTVIQPAPPWSPRASMGGVQALGIDSAQRSGAPSIDVDGVQGASDPRKDGLALGF